MTPDEPTEADAEFGWLVDVPLFIDEDRVERLYDVAVEEIFNLYRTEEVGVKMNARRLQKAI